MSDFIVFYGAQIYGEYSRVEYIRKSIDLPDGCFIRYPGKTWYLKQFGGLTPINLSDLSNEVKMYCLVLGIKL